MADGSKCWVKHYATIDFHIGDFHSTANVVVTSCRNVVLDSNIQEHEPLILGTDWLDSECVVLRYGPTRSVLVGRDHLDLMSGVKLYCICRKPDDHRVPMVQCADSSAKGFGFTKHA